MFCFSSNGEESNGSAGAGSSAATVIPSQDSLIGDLLSMDINPTPMINTDTAANAGGADPVDLLGGGLDSFVSVVNVMQVGAL